jgi:pimeloyl-ACP methyl ester carboxylesterase
VKATTLQLLAAPLALAIATPALAAEKASAPSPWMNSQITQSALKSGHVTANGVSYYYQVHGKGGRGQAEPLLLLHGGLGQIEMFGPNLTALARGRQVVGVDLQGHGRSSLGDREISLVDMGDDMAAVLKSLGYQKVDVMGYSMGGGVAFRFAVQHPDMVRRLVLVSAGFAQDGFHPELLPMQAAVGAATAEQMKGTPMYESYMALSPRPQDFPKLLDRMGALMRKPYDWSADVKKLTMPTLLVFGDSDMFRPEHEVKFYQLLGGGLKDAGWQREHMSKNRLAILPDVTHYEMGMAPALAATVMPFLDKVEGK